MTFYTLFETTETTVENNTNNIMKTLFHKQDKDLVLEHIQIGKQIMWSMVESLIEFAETHGKFPITDKKCIVQIGYQNHRWDEDVAKFVHRVINLMNRSPMGISVNTEENTLEEQLDWFVKHAGNLRKIMEIEEVGAPLVYTIAQVAEKGFRKELREKFGVGIIDGQVAKGTVYELAQSQTYQEAGGKGKISSDAKKYHVNEKGLIVEYKKSKRENGGKQLDRIIEGEYCKSYTTDKAKTVKGDGGGTTSEYESDLGKTLGNRAKNFASNGYQIEDGKIQLLFGVVDSRFFNRNPNAIKIIQSKIGKDVCDTFLTDSITMAQFLNEIDVPEVLTDTKNVLTKAFDKFSIEIL